MKTLRKIIEIDEAKCDGCGQCVNACAEGALEIIDGKAKVVADTFCDGLGACIGDCPRGALKIVEREADAFDEKAVEERLKRVKSPDSHGESARGCPGSAVKSFQGISTNVHKSAAQDNAGSALSHWPVQIRLAPANASFLKGADLLIAADCTAFAYARFHTDILAGKALLVGCPKLDDAQQIQNKLADIFRTAGVKSVSVVIMEVPCCSRLPMIVKKAMEISGVEIPLKEIVVGIQGALLK